MFQPHSGVVFTPLDDNEAILLHLDTKQYYSLNETGRRIWEMATQGHTPIEIAQAITDEYEVGWDVALNQTEGLLSDLTREQLLLA